MQYKSQHSQHNNHNYHDNHNNKNNNNNNNNKNTKDIIRKIYVNIDMGIYKSKIKKYKIKSKILKN